MIHRQASYTSKKLIFHKPFQPMSYYPATQTQTLCIPATKHSQCQGCSRYRSDRIGVQQPVIDATVVKWIDGMCPLKVSL